MKNEQISACPSFLLGILLTFMVSASSASSTSAAYVAATKYKTYANKKFGYSIEYPDIYDKIIDPYTDRGGIDHFGAYSSKGKGDGRYAFRISGGKKPKGADGNSLLKDATNMEEDKYGYVYGVEPIPGTAKSGTDFYMFDYLDNSTLEEEITHVYCVVGKSQAATYWIRYPKEDAERFAAITTRMDKSLKLKERK